MKDSTQRKLGAILSYVSIFASTLVQLLYTPFLIKMLGQSEYGLYSLIASVIGYLTVLDLGFGNAIVVYTAKYRAQGKVEEEKKLHGMFKIIFYIIGVIAFLLGIILYFNVNAIFGANMTSTEIEKAKVMMLILSFNLLMTFAFNIYQSIITANEKFTFQKIMAILNTILKPVIMIPLLFLGFKSIAMTVVITIVNCIVLLSNYFYCRNKLNIRVKYNGFDKSLFKVILCYSIWLFLGAIVDKVNWSVDQTILGMVSGTVAVSIYSVAATLNQLFINLSTAISGVMLPKVTKMIANKATNEELTNEMIKVGRIQFYVIFLMVTGLIFFGKEFIIWWVGKDFIDAYYVALWLIIPISFPLIQNIGLSIMQAKNKYKFKSISTAIMAVINIFISYFLAKQFGPLGCAIGTGLALIVCNIIVINIYYYKELNLDIFRFWKDILIMIIKFVPVIILMILIIYFTRLSGFISIIVYGCIYVFLYALISYLIVFNSYEKGFINIILKKLKFK